jgi:catechol 2,3-dioxygenase-like lactoylglutathione lyase family enzyme
MRFTIHPELPAADARRARRWYLEKLGLEPVMAGGEPILPGEPIEADTELLYGTGTATFGVYRSEHAGTNLATAARIVVDDFDAVRAELLARGVVFEDYDLGPDFRTVDGVLVSPDGEKTAWFKDSEGNLLALGSV